MRLPITSFMLTACIGKRRRLHRDSKVSAQNHTDLHREFMKPLVELVNKGIAYFDAEIQHADASRETFSAFDEKCSSQRTLAFLEANARARKVALEETGRLLGILRHLEAWDVVDKDATAQLERSR